jgi:hypothetical protein
VIPTKSVVYNCQTKQPNTLNYTNSMLYKRYSTYFVRVSADIISLEFYTTKIDIYVRFEVFTEVTMKNGVYWDITPCGSSKNRRFEEPSASFIRVTRIGELGTTLAATSNRRTSRMLGISSQRASVASCS